MPGVMVYSWNQGDVYVLLGKEGHGRDKGKWDHFSGAKEKTDRTNKDAAAREGAEESCCLFGNQTAIQNKMFPLNSGDSSYLLKVNYERGVDHRFQAQKNKSQFKASKYQEKSNVKWVKLATLIDGAVNRKGIFQDGKDKIALRDYFTTMVSHNRQNFYRLFPHLIQSPQNNAAPKPKPAVGIKTAAGKKKVAHHNKGLAKRKAVPQKTAKHAKGTGRKKTPAGKKKAVHNNKGPAKGRTAPHKASKHAKRTGK